MFRAIRVFIATGSCVLLIGCNGCKPKGDETPGKVRTVNPKYVEIYSVTQNADANHSVALEALNGMRWYREDRPILDLSQCISEKSMAQKTAEGGHGVSLIVREEYATEFMAFFPGHLGKNVGVMVGGKLIDVVQVRGPVSNRLILRLQSKDEAQRVAAIIRNGGFPLGS